MANEQNLISLCNRTQRERNEIAKMGAEASNKVQKTKRQMKHQFEMLMSLGLQDDNIKKEILCLGVPDDEITLQMAMCVVMIQQSLSGNVKAFELIRDTLGQSPKNENQEEEKETIIFVNDIEYMLSLQEDNNEVTK